MHGYGDPEAQKELDEALLKEADETLPVAMDQVPMSVPLSAEHVSYPLTTESVSAPVFTPSPSSSKLGDKELQKMKEKFNSLRSSVPKVTRPEVQNLFHRDTPASMTLPYPGLDGHQRRITPIPVTLPLPQMEKPAPQPAPKSLSKFG